MYLCPFHIHWGLQSTGFCVHAEGSGVPVYTWGPISWHFSPLGSWAVSSIRPTCLVCSSSLKSGTSPLAETQEPGLRTGGNQPHLIESEVGIDLNQQGNGSKREV